MGDHGRFPAGHRLDVHAGRARPSGQPSDGIRRFPDTALAVWISANAWDSDERFQVGANGWKDLFDGGAEVSHESPL